MADNTLASYLVKIGFDVDKAAQAKMTNAVRDGAAQAQLFTDAVESAVKSFASMVGKIADGLEDLYYASKRTNSSVAEIQSIERTAERMGAKVGEATSSLENFSRFLKQNPNSREWVAGLAHISQAAVKGMSDAQLLQATVKDLSKTAPLSLRYAWMSELGISENTWRAMSDGSWLKNLALFIHDGRDFWLASVS
jgi:methyl-accepting chemotaxis protein